MIGSVLAPNVQFLDANRIVFMMPPGAVTAPVTVTVGAQSASLVEPYIVLP
jgi:hypothetical protein